MSIEWDRDLLEWSSGLRPAHLKHSSSKDGSALHDYIRSMKDSPWTQSVINGISYYGKSLDGEYWKKIKTGGKIVATGLSFCMVVTIPVLLYMGAHEKMVLWVLQIHTSSTLKYKITHQPVISPPSANPPLDVNRNGDVLGLLFKSATNLNPEEAKNYFGTLLSVAKNVVPDKEDLRLDLINKGKLKLHEIPELKGKKKNVVNYICKHGKKLTYIEFLQTPHWDWNDEDLEKMLKACPNLKTFIYESSGKAKVTSKGIEEVSNLHQLETLQLSFCPLPSSLDALKNLKKLSLTCCSGPVPTLDHLTQLEKLDLWAPKNNFPILDKLLNLKELQIVSGKFDMPKLDKLVGLEKLELSQKDQDTPSLEALVNLIDLKIRTDRSLPSLKNLEKLRKLEISAHSIDDLELASHAPLQELSLTLWVLKNFPKLDKPELLHSLYLKIEEPSDLFDDIKQFSNLRCLTTLEFSAKLMNHLPHLEELSTCRGSFSQLNRMTAQQKSQLKKLKMESYRKFLGTTPYPLVDPDKLSLFLLDDFVNLEELWVENFGESVISLEKNTALKKLSIEKDKTLQSIEHLDKLTQLTDLFLRNCSELKLQRASLNALENLTDLTVMGCDKIWNKKKRLISERLVRLQKATFCELGVLICT